MNETDSNTVLEALVDLATQDERKGLPSASKWPRYEECAASYQLEQEARRLGQEAHSEPSAESTKGDRIHAKLAGKEISLSESEQTSYEFLRERAEDQIKRIFGDEKVHELLEQRFELKMDGKLVATGRADRVVYKGDKALLIDYKTGFSEPDPAEINSQLKILAVLVALQLPQVSTVYVQIVSGPYGVTEASYGIKKLAAAFNDIAATLKRINSIDPPFSPSAAACRYCPAANICPALADLRKRVGQTSLLALPDANEEAASLLEQVETLQGHLDAIQAYYKTRMEENPNYTIPGWGLVPGPPKRTVIDWVAARAKLGEFIDSEKLDKLASYSVVDTERLLGQAIGVKGEKLKEQFKLVLGDLLDLKYPAPSLKRVKGQPALTAL